MDTKVDAAKCLIGKLNKVLALQKRDKEREKNFDRFLDCYGNYHFFYCCFCLLWMGY